MGARKHQKAEERKKANANRYIARLRDFPTSPRKMRLMADMIRGEGVEYALQLLKHSPQAAAGTMYKLLLSAISNWQVKNEGARMEEANLYVKLVRVDNARILKRIQPRAQGRANRIRKRSSHITIELDSKDNNVNNNS
ncbi:MAG: 50S ribosomal protein L22 [Bacteroidales bacterium]|nr:50S ribosomal protein L22 [Bacteroidales bacterium]